jgi:hypothetical protein
MISLWYCGGVHPLGNRKALSDWTYEWFLASWAKRLSWKEVAEAILTNWDHLFYSAEMAVTWGCKHRDLTNIGVIGIDEAQLQRGINADVGLTDRCRV